MFKILVVIKKTEGYSATKSVGVTSQVIEFELKDWADEACKKLQAKEGYDVTKLYA